jgi:sec-independent protein translocase protein TatA
MGALSPTHWLIIIAVLVVLFGAKRLPDAARSLGRSARILKAEVQEAGKDGQGVEQAATADSEAAAGAPSLVVDPVAAPSARMSA